MRSPRASQWEWESFGEYLDALERMPRAVDIGTQIPHAAVRGYVMGDRALDAPTADDLDAMQRAVADGLRRGCARAVLRPHRRPPKCTANPVPGTFADEDELAALLAAMAKAGTGVLQVVPAGVGGEMGGDQRHSIDAEIEWIARLGTQYRSRSRSWPWSTNRIRTTGGAGSTPSTGPTRRGRTSARRSRRRASAC